MDDMLFQRGLLLEVFVSYHGYLFFFLLLILPGQNSSGCPQLFAWMCSFAPVRIREMGRGMDVILSESMETRPLVLILRVEQAETSQPAQQGAQMIHQNWSDEELVQRLH